MSHLSAELIAATMAVVSVSSPAIGAGCAGSAASGLGRVQRAWVLSDGGNKTCTGRFMTDVARIRAAGWKDPSVGAINWFGILGNESVSVAGRLVNSVVPVVQADGSGFFVSPTALADTTIADVADQSRYVNALRVPAAVAPRSLLDRGIALGGFGVAYDVNRKIAVPFVVGDVGPRIGEGSVALARLVAGEPLKDNLSRAERFVGQVDEPDVMWIFFKTTAAKYDSKNEAAMLDKAKAAYSAWGETNVWRHASDLCPAISWSWPLLA